MKLPVDVIAQTIRIGSAPGAGATAEEIVKELDRAGFVILPKEAPDGPEEEIGLTAAPQNLDVDKLVDELFHAVQMEQGLGFVGDGETFAGRADFFRRIRGRLEWNRAAVRKMRNFLKKYGELGQ